MEMNKYHFDSVKHAHYLNDKPLMGCSTIVNIIAKPLQWWVAEQTLKPLGWQKYNKKIDGKYKIVPDKIRLPDVDRMRLAISEMRPKVFLELLDSCYTAHNNRKEEAGEKGTERHATLEKYVKHCMKEHDGKPYKDLNETIQVFIDWAQVHIKRFLWSEVHTYSKELWTGGVADVGWEDLQGRVVAGDFKSSKDVFFSQFLQVAGYDTMLSESGGYDADGNKTFTLKRPIEAYCVAPFGQDEFDPIIMDYVEEFRSAFKSCTHIHKLNELFKKVKQSRPIKPAEEPKTGTLAELLAV